MTLVKVRPDAKFRGIVYLFKIVGLASMAYDAENVERPFGPSRIGHCYNVLLMCALLLPNYYSLAMTYSNVYENQARSEMTADLIQTAFHLFNGLFVVGYFSLFQRRSVELANRLVAAHRSRPNDDDSSGMRATLRRILIFELVSLILQLVTVPKAFIFIVYFVGAVINGLILNLLLMQYSLVARLLQHGYGSVNSSVCKLDRDFASLMQHYRLLQQLARDISDFYSPVMLVGFVNLFLNLILYSYYVLLPVLTLGREFSCNNVLLVLYCLNYTIFCIVSLFILTSFTTAAVKESQKTGGLLSLVDRQSLPNVAMLKQLKQFSSYLLHAPPMSFGVFDLFVIDQTLVVSLVASITTYLIILLQSRGPKDQDCK
ncbi:uncharacterized protein LOC106651330 [Trichogramma pretiosum]|uniref:uncharacterized protein LOC106651330 n=1 Tax=Trichogramma pretiosum TaxID=7493 RepID=UPI0006C9D138|nr:uncharacterized protein LOC106651330 [Trichogramma pretiosum]